MAQDGSSAFIDQIDRANHGLAEAIGHLGLARASAFFRMPSNSATRRELDLAGVQLNQIAVMLADLKETARGSADPTSSATRDGP